MSPLLPGSHLVGRHGHHMHQPAREADSVTRLCATKPRVHTSSRPLGLSAVSRAWTLSGALLEAPAQAPTDFSGGLSQQSSPWPPPPLPQMLLAPHLCTP